MKKSVATQILRQHKLRATPNRIHLLGLIHKHQTPISIAELITKCKQTDKNPDTATIYRNIEHFYQSNIITRLDFHEGYYRYELTDQSHHHHLVCQDCGSIQPIYDQCLGISNQKIKKSHGFQVTTHSLEFFGLCAACQ